MTNRLRPSHALDFFRVPVSATVFVTVVFCFAMVGQLRAEDAESLTRNTGQKIYTTHCLQCHGERGQGSETHSDSLHGDLPVEDLAEYIDEAMPEEDPSLCVGEDAKQVAKYIYDKFYSPGAQEKLSSTRIELSRLTVRQFQESIADLTVSFGDPHWTPKEKGLKATYFAARRWTEDRKLAEQTDPTIDFADRVPHFEPDGKYKKFDKDEEPEKKKNDNNQMNVGFAVFWSGSVIAPDTGLYSINVQSKNGFQLWVNDLKTPLIDQEVRSDDVNDHVASLYLIGGRAYAIRLNLFSYPDPPAKVRLLWDPPNGSEEVIPATQLIPIEMTSSLAVSTAFPADDASDGYERGISVSQQWDESTTAAAIETANWVAENLWRLAKTKETDRDRVKNIQSFARQFVERAFVNQLTDEEVQFFVTQHFENELPIKDQIKRVVILALKSPRFLYPELESRDPSFEIARRLALVLWDSIPDKQLSKLAREGKLTQSKILDGELDRMIEDPRSKAKLQSFFHYWLKTDKAAEATKDKSLYPDFDDQVLNDMRQSLDLYLDEVVWNEKSDFRQLFLADYLFANQRLTNFYGLESKSTEFVKVQVDPNQRAGILTHPYLMTGLAYHKESSPIHRGVFIARNLLGRSLKQPPDNVKPLTEEFNPAMTTRQRVEHQTKETACMNCHSVINPLGFSLENFDAVGRFRTAEKDKTIDVAAAYKTPAGETVPLGGARDLANFLAADSGAQRSFINQLFHYYVKQSLGAYGDHQLDVIHEKFVGNDFNIRQLLIEIAKLSAAPQ